jgi:hypothetical protein
MNKKNNRISNYRLKIINFLYKIGIIIIRETKIGR